MPSINREVREYNASTSTSPSRQSLYSNQAFSNMANNDSSSGSSRGGSSNIGGPNRPSPTNSQIHHVKVYRTQYAAVGGSVLSTFIAVRA